MTIGEIDERGARVVVGPVEREAHLLAALLHVITNELLGIFFKDFINFVEQVIEVSFQLVALGRVDGDLLAGGRVSIAALLLDPLLFTHISVLPVQGRQEFGSRLTRFYQLLGEITSTP